MDYVDQGQAHIADLANPTCNTARIFQQGELYYAKPLSLNDPYEAHIEFDLSACKEKAFNSHFRVLRERNRLLGNNLETLLQTSDQVQRNVEQQMEHIRQGTMDFNAYYRDTMNQHGVLSLSAERNHLLMWAHYASEHKGICLGFNWEKTGLPEAREVTYSTNYRLVDIWSYTEDELAEIACYQKSAEWSYEHEWRSLSRPEFERYSALELTPIAEMELKEAEAACDDFRADLIKKKHTFGYRRVKVPGFQARKFNKHALEEVIFGARMTKKDARHHVKFIEGLGYAPRFYQVVRDPKRYALNLASL